MDPNQIDPAWPNSLRWFMAQDLYHFTPWHLIKKSGEFAGAAKAFDNEDVNSRKVFAFASRQDNDDYAGFEIIDGKITDRVICFHPVFSTGVSKRNWDIVFHEYDDLFDFMSAMVMPDMKDWATSMDANDIDD